MAVRVFSRRTGEMKVNAGADDVMWGISLPEGTKIHDIKCKVQMLTDDRQLSDRKAHGYSIEMYLLPIFDPDSAQAFNDVWDKLVTKDQPTNTLDLDTAVAATSPMWEPGEHDITKMFDVGYQAEQLWAVHRIATVANPRHVIIKQMDVETPFETIWQGGGIESVHVGRKLSVTAPMVLCFGMGIPSFDSTTATPETTLSEAQWAQLQYVEHVMERMFVDALGLTEAGAETPYEEAAVLIFAHVEPAVFEESTGWFDTEAYRTVFEAVIDHSLQGNFDGMVLSSGR